MEAFPYDRTSKESIENYALKLKAKTFKDVLIADPYLNEEQKTTLINYFNNPRNKGNLGNLIEEHYFFYKRNSSPKPDFNEAGIELKVTPYLIKNNGDYRAKERLVLSNINYDNDYKEETFLDSHVYEKCALMLLVYYLYEPTKERMDYIMNYIKLFQFPEGDLEIIKNDYLKIIGKIKFMF